MIPIPTSGGAPARLLATAAALLLAAACADQPTGPQAPGGAAHAVAGSADRPFYYYGDERILLDVDPTGLSVTSALPPQASAQSVLATLGVEVLGAQKMQHGHWLLELAPGTDAASAGAAARALRADARFGFAANVYRLAQGRSRVILLDRVAVQLQEGATRADVARLNAQLGTRTLSEPQPSQPDVWWLGYRKDGDPLELAARLNQHPLVVWADPDKVQELELLATPTDPNYGDQFYLRSNAFRGTVRIDVNAEPAWDLSYGAWSAAAGPLTVAVVDNGVQTYHPDLPSGAHVGYDAINGTWDAWACTDCASNPNSESAHGTAVAGILSAQHNNGLGVAGLAPAVRIMPIRIFRTAGGYDTRASDCAIGLAINNAWYNGAQVMNNSWRLPAASSCVTSAINRATTEGRGGKGTVMVFAAGNSSNRPGTIAAVTYPGNLPNVLTVSALQRDGTVSPYSSGGAEVDVAAFGGAWTGDVWTTDLIGGAGYASGDYTAGFNGTSAAAPQAAAVAAMVISRNPTWTELQVRDRVKASADPWGTATDFGSGKLNAYRALVGRVSISISGNTHPSFPDEYTWTASASGGAGTYSYRWERSDDGGPYYTVSSGTSYTSYVDYDQNFTLRVTVTDGPDAHTATRVVSITGPYSNTCQSSGGGTVESAGAPGDATPMILLPPACP